MRYLGKVRQKLGGIFLLVSLSRLWVKEGLVLVMVFVWVMTHLHNCDFQKYIEARGEESTIEIGRNVMINNGSAVIADKSSIHIGDETLIGPGFMCLGSNFHPLSPDKRKTSDYTCKPIIIGRNVFIGANVTILQGVEIGDNSVIGAGCLISQNVEKNKIVRANAPIIETLNID
ncbi:DapH/DapD/GlmU-related protein [Vibrio parahaemolyticus]|uniref:DapH/DapD/GlmU-related protein n=2 Tax=Vibrio TaxID=662 RepID=UPI0011EDB02C|nr:DapH/DapD/GlmU-related protein [Vibrio parahaemolyticus]MCX4126239.1 DapH/DapD/GlmU-related protein [Vibrio parahaemolyticus]MDF4416946.1 DapH/DapD/GlmU-related protein [Vibrio parahaemolyticus]MDG2583359.1 DapH/DapD/GlmU-related protein [Vibrio parahaemolyticus]MDG2818650.1 DapH/DapD/GlmU-related protein [Vibrio parahaemolyticus]QHH16306.1 acyltransferase [Vibrio parahaemolyticus]